MFGFWYLFLFAVYVGKLWLAGGFLWSCPSVRVFVRYVYWIHLDFFRLEVDGGLMAVYSDGRLLICHRRPTIFDLDRCFS